MADIMIPPDDTSEAYHLFEIEDDIELDESRRRTYITRKTRKFKKEDLGKWVLVQKAKYDKEVMSILYLVDRRKNQKLWWSYDSKLAMIFEKKSAAETQKRKLKYGKITVKQINKTMIKRTFIIGLVLVLSFISCTGPKESLYGKVIDVVAMSDTKIRYKVWCEEKGKYYYVTKDRDYGTYYQKEEIIKIK